MFLFTESGDGLSCGRIRACAGLKAVVEILRSGRPSGEKLELLQRLGILSLDPRQIRSLVTSFRASRQLDQRIDALVGTKGPSPVSPVPPDSGRQNSAGQHGADTGGGRPATYIDTPLLKVGDFVLELPLPGHYRVSNACFSIVAVSQTMVQFRDIADITAVIEVNLSGTRVVPGPEGATSGWENKCVWRFRADNESGQLTDFSVDHVEERCS